MGVINDVSLGVIVFYQFPRSLKYLVLKHSKGHWSFAKGHQNKGEAPIETAKRELYEEAGIDEVEFVSKKILIRESYIYTNKNQDRVRKSVSYFIAGSGTSKVKVDNLEIINYKWCTVKAAEKIITFRESRSLLRKADRLVSKHFQKN